MFSSGLVKKKNLWETTLDVVLDIPLLIKLYQNMCRKKKLLALKLESTNYDLDIHVFSSIF